MAVLLQSTTSIEQTTVEYPLLRYAATHWSSLVVKAHAEWQLEPLI